MKKGQGISINTIIIAAIALIVLIILIAVFSGRMSWWGRDLDKANECPGECISKERCFNEKGQVTNVECNNGEATSNGNNIGTGNPNNIDNICCIKI